MVRRRPECGSVPRSDNTNRGPEPDDPEVEDDSVDVSGEGNEATLLTEAGIDLFNVVAGNILGESFRNTTLPNLDAPLSWTLMIDSNRVSLSILQPGDYNGNGMLDAGDLDLQSQGIKDQNLKYDANGDGVVDVADRVVWTNDLKNTWMGDSDLNGVFDSSDFVIVFGEGKYETGEPATWGQGDWNGDMLFDSGDFVTAFGSGGYEMGEQPGGPNPVTAAVPEPSSPPWL